ncbi:unnamed protein product, partial [Effrenium voratum]
MMYNTQKTLNIEPLGHMGRWTEECHEKLLRDLQAPKGHVRGRKRRDRLAILDANTQDPLPIQDAPIQQEQQLAEDHQGTSEKDEGMSEDHHGISEKDEGVFEDQQGVSKKDEGVSEDNHGISEKYEDVSEDQQATMGVIIENHHDGTMSLIKILHFANKITAAAAQRLITGEGFVPVWAHRKAVHSSLDRLPGFRVMWASLTKKAPLQRAQSSQWAPDDEALKEGILFINANAPE